MDDNFHDRHDVLYRRAKFDKDRTTRAGCRCENVVFFWFVTLLVRFAVRSIGLHSLNTHCVAVYRSISTRFGVYFSEGSFFRCENFRNYT